MANKIHFAYVERGTESSPHDEWGETVCGLELDDKYLTNRKKYTTCKNCLAQLAGLNDSGFSVNPTAPHPKD